MPSSSTRHLNRFNLRIVILTASSLATCFFSTATAASKTDEKSTIVIGLEKVVWDTVPHRMSISLVEGELKIDGTQINIPDDQIIDSRELLPAHANFWRKEKITFKTAANKVTPPSPSRNQKSTSKSVPDLEIYAPHPIGFILPQQTSDFQIAIYSESDAKKKWLEVSKLSKNYKFSEPEGNDWDQPLVNFPHSSYGLNTNGTFNNGNTYIFHIASPVMESKTLRTFIEKNLTLKILGNEQPISPTGIHVDPIPIAIEEETTKDEISKFKKKVKSLPAPQRERLKALYPLFLEEED